VIVVLPLPDAGAAMMSPSGTAHSTRRIAATIASGWVW
jgi:hypothetical protein